MARRAGTAQVVTIYWRDIPAQVNGQSGRERHQVVLSSKFQRAIDRAKRKAKIYTAEEDIAQWRRETSSCDGDASAAADAEAARLERETSREYLGRLAYAGGFAADIDQHAVDRSELLALEELDDESNDAEATNTDGSTDPADPAAPAIPEQEAT
jgi:hypothetical protein